MKRIKQIVLIVVAVFLWDSAVFVINEINTEAFILNAQIAELNTQISQLESSLVEKDSIMEGKEVTYKASVIRMVENIQRSDSFLNVGGPSKSLDYDIDSFLLAMDSDMYSLNLFLDDAEKFFNNRVDYFKSIPNIWPVAQSSLNRITSQFGVRFNPFTLASLGNHKGIDIDSYYGAPVLATADGTVIDHWIYHKSYGRSIRIKHNNGFTTFYGHMSKTIVHEGWKVKKGDIIGYIGATGKATGPHIHYEIIKDGVKVDPINYLRETYAL